MKLFIGGVFVGMIITITIAIVLFIVWRKFLKKKVDNYIFKAGLKAIEKQKEKE